MGMDSSTPLHIKPLDLSSLLNVPICVIVARLVRQICCSGKVILLDKFLVEVKP